MSAGRKFSGNQQLVPRMAGLSLDEPALPSLSNKHTQFQSAPLGKDVPLAGIKIVAAKPEDEPSNPFDIDLTIGHGPKK